MNKPAEVVTPIFSSKGTGDAYLQALEDLVKSLKEVKRLEALVSELSLLRNSK